MILAFDSPQEKDFYNEKIRELLDSFIVSAKLAHGVELTYKEKKYYIDDLFEMYSNGNVLFSIETNIYGYKFSLYLDKRFLRVDISLPIVKQLFRYNTQSHDYKIEISTNDIEVIDKILVNFQDYFRYEY